ncbi:hypothetical protein RND71_013965 [Anisodus tanguticus]|uniref:Uncharacterized protein n=1 Tax=Anisodus tanguticus TaxID=243964 RepID=A0AAE1VNA1_9SOLA|nr:hypothetical protein RND71_013965 [Anisodus tanguticus]
MVSVYPNLANAIRVSGPARSTESARHSSDSSPTMPSTTAYWKPASDRIESEGGITEL